MLSAQLNFVVTLFGIMASAAALVAAEGNFVATTPVPAEYLVGFETIRESDSQELLRTLVEGEMQGRGTGQGQG